MHRFAFILWRPLQLIPVLLGVSLITFVLVRSIPGDPARMLLGTRATPERLAMIRERFGLDEPLWLQYLYFLRNLFRGEMGTSVVYRVDTSRLIAERLEPTLILLAGGIALAILIALPLALLAARRRGAADQAVRLFSTLSLGMPAFWLGIVLILIFSLWLGWLPVSGYARGFPDLLRHMVLPWLTIALPLAAVITRTLRAALIEALESDLALAARARGLSPGRVFLRHALPNAVVPTINLLAVNIGWLIGGTVVIEEVFGIPGIGQLLVRAIFGRDYLVVQSIALCFAVATVLVNFAADILTVAIDPRVKL